MLWQPIYCLEHVPLTMTSSLFYLLNMKKAFLKVKFYLRRFINRPIGFDKFEAAKDVIYKDRIK